MGHLLDSVDSDGDSADAWYKSHDSNGIKSDKVIQTKVSGVMEAIAVIMCINRTLHDVHKE